jgi:hypothetical protein
VADRRTLLTSLLALALAAAAPVLAREAASAPAYGRVAASADGIGKTYMGREIASVMGWQAAGWLERPEREKEEDVERMVASLRLPPARASPTSAPAPATSPASWLVRSGPRAGSSPSTCSRK